MPDIKSFFPGFILSVSCFQLLSPKSGPQPFFCTLCQWHEKGLETRISARVHRHARLLWRGRGKEIRRPQKVHGVPTTLTAHPPTRAWRILRDFWSCTGLWEGRRTWLGQSLGDPCGSVHSEIWKISFLSPSQNLTQFRSSRAGWSVFNHYTFILCF